MKLCLIAALIAVASSGPLSDQQSDQQDQWPWQEGKQYRYEVKSHTLAYFEEGPSSGNAFKAHFIVRVKAPGHLNAKLENPQYAQFHQHLQHKMELPDDLKYKAAENLDKPFEITVKNGRVISLKVPTSLSLSNENLLKGLISALQVDLSPHRHVRNPQDSFDKESQQGLFSKIETDVTGDCETLYAVSPVTSEWKRELPQFASEEDPMEITKSKNYGHCRHRFAYSSGVRPGEEWTGTAHKNSEKQFIFHGSVTRILAGKQGHIYKAETTSTVTVNPHIYGKQKAEVHSYVKLYLESVEADNGPQWPKPEAQRQIPSLMYAINSKQVVNHDDSSSSSESSEESRERSSISQTNFNQQSHEDPYSHKSSSSSDSSMASINDDLPKMNEPAYAALYMNHQSHGDKKQTPMNAQKLLLDLSQQLQNPNNMPKAEFLTKFNILVRLISSMSTDQLAQTSRSIEVGKASNNIVKADMWMIFRDAVTQAGTLPAFQQIKTWIKNKKIQNEEAAQVITSLATTLRYPTKDVMKQFFDLALSPDVEAQKYLNTSALIAATKFIRMGYVDREMADSYYPIQMYGRFTPKHDRFVLEDILPRLTEKLKQYAEQEEYSKAQVIIKAIGTLGHREMLYVFAPYLEGKREVPTYLRVQMIFELKPLAEQKDRYARAVLYSILRNTAEPFEVRVAAILNIFKADPTTDMLQAMAQMTNDDPSIHVRAVIKTGIETAADLDDPRRSHLSRSAQAVRNIVTQENLGYHLSTAVFYDNQEDQEDVSQLYSTTYIGSDDSLIPKLHRLTWSNKLSGPGVEHTLGFSLSSAKDLADYIKQLVFEPRKSPAQQQYSADKVSQMLNIKRDKREPPQSSYFLNIFDQERFFAMDEADIKDWVQNAAEFVKEMESGKEQHYTKVFLARQISVMFPVASGVPFVYKYKEPVVVHIQTKYNGKFNYSYANRDMYAKSEHEIQFIFARNMDGSVGFIDTFSDQLASAGVVTKYQINVPVKVNIEGKSGQYNLKLEPLRPDQDTTLAHYSVWPYSALQKKDSLTPVSQDSTTQLVERPKKVSSTDVKFGQQTGTSFQLQGYSYSQSFRRAGNLLNALSNIEELMAPSDLAQTYYVIKHLGKQSKTKAVTLTATFDEFYNQKNSGEFAEANKFNDVTANSTPRREEMVKRVSSGINTATVRVVDLSASFEGPQKYEYVLTAAYAESLIDRKVQAAVFLGSESAQHGNEQINAILKLETPEIALFNYQEALRKDIKFTYLADIKYGQNSNINAKGHTERSQKYTEELKNRPLAKECEQEIANGNQIQPSCYEMLIEAQSPDVFKTSITYKNVPATHKALVSQAYYYPQNNIEYNPSKKAAEGQIQVDAQMYYADQSLSIEVTSPNGHAKYENIPIPDYTSYLLSAYRPFGVSNAYENWASYKSYMPYCAVDAKKVNTFSDRVYEYQVSKSWHLVMLEQESKDEGKWGELVFLAKRPTEKQLELYISRKTETGKDFEIQIPSSAAKDKANVNVKTNGKKVSDGDLTIYWDDVADVPLLQYVVDPEGVLRLSIGDEGFYVLFDGERVVIATQNNRKFTRGICGQNTAEPRDDYETPYGTVDESDLYGASYALDAEKDPRTQELKKQAQQKAYQIKPKYTMILRFDEVWKKAAEKRAENWGSQSVYRARNYNKQRGQCQLHNQVQYHENHGEICITTTPVPSCQSHCHGGDYKIQAVQAICKSKSDQQFKTFKKQIQQGQNPQVEGVPKVEQYKVPSSCTA